MPKDALSGTERPILRRRVRAPRKGQPRNALAVHTLTLDIEAFSDFAWSEIADVREATFGVCALPQCSCQFNPMKPNQIFCSDQCRQIDDAERRKVGMVAAPALLAMRQGKYAKKDTPEHRLFRKAWSYLGQLNTAWKQDRDARRKAAQNE